MALYDGFFDAVQDENTGEYDRAYSSGDFTGYFGNLIGSGVCVHKNSDSFKVRLENGAAVVSPGYLFIRGYWLRNDADYTIDLPGTSNYAIVAHLNLGQRLIELKADSVAQAYPDSLVLAIVSPTSAEDTRYNTDICGIIDTAGELSNKTEWAINYINNEIESKLQQVEQDIYAQEQKLDAKIAEVQAVADSIVPPPVGTIKFSASQDVGEEWLQCDGSFINESDYPELVAALGKLTPSGDKFQLISSGEIGPQISNGALYDGRLWVYSYTTKKLYGVDVDGTTAVKEISVTSENLLLDKFLPPSETYPLCLSIASGGTGEDAKIFLSQIISNDTFYSSSVNPIDFSGLPILCSDFTGSESEIAMTPPFSLVTLGVKFNVNLDAGVALPYVISKKNGSVKSFYCAIGGGANDVVSIVQWEDGTNEAKILAPIGTSAISTGSSNTTYTSFSYQKIAYSHKNKDEAVSIKSNRSNASDNFSTSVRSSPTNLFYQASMNTGKIKTDRRNKHGPINIGGYDKILSEYDKTGLMWASIDGKGVGNINYNVSFPSASRVFVDAAAYLWGKDIYMIFVGTGIIFSRTLEEKDFGYLDTTSVLGTITQFGYLDYSQDEGTLYLLGQDTTNAVKVAKIVLNTLYDYANDGAWLPMIASDGVPAYIKAYEPEAKT